MKKHLLFLWLAVACAVSLGHAQSTTTHYGLYKPADHEKEYGSKVSNNFDIIDSHLYTLSLTTGLPGGTGGKIQYNNSGVFGGFTMSGDCTINTSTGVLICTKTNGSNFAAVATSGSASDLLSGITATARGGTGTGSALIGIMRGGNPMTAVELSGDCVTSGSNVTTCLKPPGAGTDGVVSSGLMAQYRVLPTESAGALVDYSGNANTATGTIGTAPTIISTSGGINCTGNGAVSLPAGLNSALTIQVYMSKQAAASSYESPIGGNGNGSVGNAIAILLQQPTTSAMTITSFANGGFRGGGSDMFAGVGSIALSMTGSGDRLFVNGTQLGYSGSSSSIGLQTVGNYQLCGSAGGSGIAAGSYLTGQVYYALFYNRALSTAEISQNFLAMQQAMALRSITIGLGSTATGDVILADGDSILNGAGGTDPLAAATLTGTYSKLNDAISGQTMATLATFGTTEADVALRNTGRNVLLVWAGTNDVAAGATAAATYNIMQQFGQARRLKGWKVFFLDMLSRGSADTAKNSLDALMRQGWRTFADGFIDEASNPLLGADGASANAAYFVGGLHPTEGSDRNLIAPLIGHAINAYYGNIDFSSATTYTTGAAAATAITAASESGNTMTFTTALNPPLGSCAVVSGVTPSGYNNVAGQCWIVQTTSGANFTAYNWTTGLGAGSVFGTAAIPLQKDEDVYTILAGSATSPSFTLETCMGYTGQNIYLKNSNTTSPWVLTPFASETIDGAANLTMPTASSGNNPVVILQSVLVSAAAAGCNWKRMQ